MAVSKSIETNTVHKGKTLIITNDFSLIYKKGTISVFDSEGKLRIRFSKYHGLQKVMCTSRLLERLFRLEARCAVSLSDSEFLVSWCGEILRIDAEKGSVLSEHTYRKSMRGPVGFCETESNGRTGKEVLYGEYFWNEEKTEVNIWMRCDGNWMCVNGFKPGIITHIHGIVYDQYRDEYVISTGDSDNESGLWRMSKDFSLIEPILVGSQKYRTCSVYPVNEGLIYATDTPIEQNYLYLMRYAAGKKVLSVNKISEMPGPCINSTVFNGMYVMATSVEPDSTLPKWKYRLTNKLGVGVHDRYSHIVLYKDDKVCEIGKFKKDIWPMWLFQFGNCQFAPYANGYMSEKHLLVTTCSVKKHDGYTVSMSYYDIKK